ncbi:MAG TPA: glycosyltransferase family 4 protein [Pyrinomonadaceae bacterium]|nr:glycosyltransferase family 4 protein [Pyrinomonadaceae bacterium]
MKVLSVFGVEPLRIGGTETFARELSLQLRDLGWESVLCFQSAPADDVRQFLEAPNVKLEVLEDSIDLNWGAVSKLWRILRRHQPDILHLHFTGFLGIYPWLGRLASVKKVFFTDQTSRPEGYVPGTAPTWKKAAVRLINLPLDKVTCVSNYGYNCMVTLGVLPSNRYEMIYNSVDLTRVKPDDARAADFRKRYSIPDDRVVVVQVSWIIPEKGITDLLKAAQLVISKNPQVHFVFVGEGAYRAQYTKDAEAMGIADHVTWTGLLKDPFGEGVYDVADILCQVSRWEEVFGWVIAEGMAYSKPVVGTRVGGIPEVVADQETGFIVDRGDATAIAERILTLAGDPKLREKMGNAGAHRVKNLFELRPNVTKLIELYTSK